SLHTCPFMSLLFLLLSSILHSSQSAVFPVVTTSFGSIRGYEFTNQGGFTAQIFKKLPFASPPVGPLRWKKPVNPEKWSETIDGTFFGPACAQRTIMYDGPSTGFSEDCLHLNVYSSQLCIQSKSCPVLFIIHGGLGIYEATMKFPDEVLVTNFVSQGLVVVTTAYRVEAFGIMALGDENALPANLAMHDVLAALKFTRSEIHSFGGDKDQITIMGHSTGAQIALHFAFSPGISPPGKPRLFRSVISMSGPSGLETEERQVERSHMVAAKLNCSGSAREIIDCMRPKSTDEILTAASTVQTWNIFANIGLVGITMAGELMPIRSAKEMIENNEPLRLMLGTTLYEVIGPGEKNDVNKVMGIENDKECFAKYTRDRESDTFVPGYNTDAQAIIMTAYTYGKAQAESGGEVYLYEYDYPEHATHTDDAYLVLGFHPYDKDSNEEWLSRVYPRYFANFAKGDRPAPDWYQLKPNLMNYYSVYRNETSDASPHMKFGYRSEITSYYTEMMEYDQRLTSVKRKVLNAPVQYH
ncbi:hypothetical protein PFISCL1PPCAC_24175, partial [Pristionchus fissidentatus]